MKGKSLAIMLIDRQSITAVKLNQRKIQGGKDYEEKMLTGNNGCGCYGADADLRCVGEG